MVVSLLYLAYHLSTQVGRMSYPSGEISMTWWTALLMMITITLGFCIVLWWRYFTFDPLKVYKDLECDLIDRGMTTQSNQGLLTTLALALGQCQSGRLIKSVHIKCPQFRRSAHIDSMMLILMIRRARGLIDALPRVTPRPAWELSGIAVICALGMVSTMHIHLVDSPSWMTPQSQKILSDHVSSVITQTDGSISTKSDDQKGMSGQMVDSEGMNSQLATQNLNLIDTTPSALRRASASERTQMSSEVKSVASDQRSEKSTHAKARSLRRVLRHRARRGGQASSGSAAATSRHRYVRLGALEISMPDQPERQSHQVRGGVNQLSVAESAHFYGVPSQLILQDFPPQLRSRLGEGTYVK